MVSPVHVWLLAKTKPKCAAAAVDLLPDTNARDVKPTWSRVRNLIDDIKHEFPQGVSFGQTIIVAKGLDARDKLKQEAEAYLQKTFPGTDAYVKLLEIGPPVGKPIQYRVSGENLQTVRDLAQKLGSIVGTDPSLRNLAFDWNEPARVVKMDVLQDKARQLGVSSQDIAMALNTVVQGNAVTQVRDNIYLVDVIGRAAEKERGSIDTLLDLQLQSSSGQSVPLSSVATFHYELEQPTIWRRDRVPTITIKAGIGDAPSRRPS
ncbi:hypothetical protein AJ87_05375 [Rhizobium yanglingense]|nr:hypothetical protein AJ87_05375 [Rhizobium yanglingense]